MRNLILENEIRSIENGLKETLETKQKLNEQIQTHKETLTSLSEEIKLKQQLYNSTKEDLRACENAFKSFENDTRTLNQKLVQIKIKFADSILKGK